MQRLETAGHVLRAILGVLGRLVLLAAIFVVAVGGGYLGYNKVVNGRSAAAAAPTVRLVSAQRGNLEATVNTTGVLVPINQARLSFKSGGKLKELNVKVGDMVKAGAVLARLDTTDLEYTLAQNLITLENNRLKLEQAKQGPKKEDLTIAKVNLEKATLNLQKAQSDYDKVAWRNDVGLTPQAASLQQATLDYQSAQANYAKAIAGSTETDLQILENAVKSSQIAVEQARSNLAGAVIVAPFDGVVASVSANVGEQVGTTALIVLVDLNNLRIEANIDETDIARVQVGQDVSVTLDSLPDLRLRGKVTAIAPNATMQSGVVTYLVHVTLSQTNPRLRAGMTATANIVVEQRQSALYIPNRAVKTSRGIRTVQVIQGGQLVEKQVRTGLANDQYTEILEGLSDGEEVAIVTTPTSTSLSQGGMGLFSGMGQRQTTAPTIIQAPAAGAPAQQPAGSGR